MRLGEQRFQLLAIAAAAILATWPTWPPLIAVWSDSADYSHGFVVGALALAWFVRRAIDSNAPPRRASWAVWPLLALSAFVWLIAYRAHSSIGQQLIAPLTVLAAVGAVHGSRVAVFVLPPIAFFYFAIPIWSSLVPLLQDAATFAVERMLTALRIPVRIEGAFVHLPSGSFQVSEGCAGLRYLVVGMATAALFAASYRPNVTRTAIYLALTAVLAVVANWLRIIVIVVAGHVTHMQHYLVSEEHISFGWAIFTLVLIAVVVIGRHMFGGHEPGAAPTLTAGHAVARPTALTLVAVGTLSLLPLAIALETRSEPLPTEGSLLPQASGSWQGPFASDLSWTPRFVGASAEAKGHYVSATSEIELYVAEYQTQQPGAELLHYGNSVAQQAWVTIEVRWFEGAAQTMRRTLLVAPDGKRWIVAHAYQVGPFRSGSAVLTQLAYGLLSLHREAPARVFAVAYRCADQCEDADSAICDFLATVNPFESKRRAPR